MNKIPPIQIPFLKTFKHPDPRPSLSPIISRDYSRPARGGVGSRARGGGAGGEKAKEITFHSH